MTVLFLAVLAVALVYELVLAVTVPPNNWDSLTYHLARVAAWHQSHGIHWIANAPTGRLNEFQPLAEQEILFLFVATGSTALFALPQYVAQLAILLAVYGAARRLGYSAPAAARSAALTRDAQPGRTRVDDGAERPGRRVVPDRRSVSVTRPPRSRGRARRRRLRARPRSQAHDGARTAGARAARVARRTEHTHPDRRRHCCRGACRQRLELRPEPRPHRSRARARAGPGRRCGVTITRGHGATDAAPRLPPRRPRSHAPLADRGVRSRRRRLSARSQSRALAVLPQRGRRSPSSRLHSCCSCCT